MKFRNFLPPMLLAAASLGCTSAFADSVLYDSSGFITGSQSNVQSFDLSTAGTLTITLSNVAWPTPLLSLNLLLTSASGAMGPEVGEGVYTFNVQAGDIFAQWFGTAGGPLNAGVYSLKIDFHPADSSAPVPLPTTALLLLSGLGLLVWQKRQRPALGEAVGVA